jgi:hypothetical protein
MQPRRKSFIYAGFLVVLCLFGWLWFQSSRNTHRMRVEQTKQVVLNSAQTLESLRLRGQLLPASDDELAAALAELIAPGLESR